MKQIKIRGRWYDVQRSSRKNKKYRIDTPSGEVHFGAKGYTIAPGTSKGDNYCARSSGITSSAKGITPNDASRAIWDCVGKKSVKGARTRRR